MPELAVALPATRAASAPPSRRWSLLDRPMLSVGLALVLLIVLLALVTPLLPLPDPNVTAPAKRSPEPV